MLHHPFSTGLRRNQHLFFSIFTIKIQICLCNTDIICMIHPFIHLPIIACPQAPQPLKIKIILIFLLRHGCPFRQAQIKRSIYPIQRIIGNFFHVGNLPVGNTPHCLSYFMFWKRILCIRATYHPAQRQQKCYSFIHNNIYSFFIATKLKLQVFFM